MMLPPRWRRSAPNGPGLDDLRPTKAANRVRLSIGQVVVMRLRFRPGPLNPMSVTVALV